MLLLQIHGGQRGKMSDFCMEFPVVEQIVGYMPLSTIISSLIPYQVMTLPTFQLFADLTFVRETAHGQGERYVLCPVPMPV